MLRFERVGHNINNRSYDDDDGNAIGRVLCYEAYVIKFTTRVQYRTHREINT